MVHIGLYLYMFIVTGFILYFNFALFFPNQIGYIY